MYAHKDDALSVSLIIPTVGRYNELENLLQSIINTNYSSLEVVIVDQNRSSMLDKLITKYQSILQIRHYKVDFRGAARARNWGLRKAKGVIVNFPDDDSFLDQDTLHKIMKLIEEAEENVAAIACMVRDPISNEPALLRFPKTLAEISCKNFFYSTIEFNLFWRRDVLEQLGGFDEMLGIGTYFGSEEGADLVVRAINSNYRILYTSNTSVYHPDKRSESIKKIYHYGRGFGRFLFKHRLDRCINTYKRAYIGRAMLGIPVYLLIRPKKSFVYMARLAGVIVGYWKSFSERTSGEDARVSR